MRIDIARHQCLSSQIDLRCTVGDGNITSGAQRHNAIVLNDDNAILNDISRRVHGDDASIGKGHKSPWTIGVYREAKISNLPGFVCAGAQRAIDAVLEKARTYAPGERCAISVPMNEFTARRANTFGREGSGAGRVIWDGRQIDRATCHGQRRNVKASRLTISDVFAYGRHANDGGQRRARVRPHVFTIVIHGNKFGGSVITTATDRRARAFIGVNAVFGAKVG